MLGFYGQCVIDIVKYESICAMTAANKLKYRTKAFDRFLHTFPFSPFYEDRASFEEVDRFSLELPSEWFAVENDPWIVVRRPSELPSLPHQGWKLHISGIPSEALEILRRVANVCFEFCVSFKHLSSWTNYYRANMKYAPRSSSGKFITVYPDDDGRFLQLLERLDQVLDGFHGPYVLSDVKYRNAPVFFRYGAFYLTPLPRVDGANRYGIYTPDGDLVEDERTPSFKLPDFVVPPVEIVDIVHQRQTPNPARLRELLYPYVVQRSLHFSNGGGVYEGYDSSTGERVVLKEARQWAGYSSEKSSAVDRLQNECRRLRNLQQHPFVPRFYDFFTVDEHAFLVEEYVEGIDLQSWIAARFPFSFDPIEIRSYEVDALKICQQIEHIVDSVHQSGIAVMDIQPKNLIITNDRAVRLIDLESACAIEGHDEQVPGTPGFVPEAGCSNRSRDIFALCNTVMYMFWPSTVAAFSSNSLLPRLRRIRELYSPFVVKYLHALVDQVDPITIYSKFPLEQSSSVSLDDPTLQRRIIDGIRQSSNLLASTRTRLYPGDSEQFSKLPGGGLNLETGALGVALILHRAGHEPIEEVEWLMRTIRSCPAMPTRGLLRGKFGVISGLCEMGFLDMAASIAQSITLDPVDSLDLSIRSGLAGSIVAALSCQAETPGILKESFFEELVSRFDKVLERDRPSNIISPYSETGNAIGLFDGWSGVALACSMLGRYFHDEIWSDRARQIIHNDLQYLKANKFGSSYIRISDIAYSYLSEGSAGVGYALTQIDRSLFANEIEQICTSLQMGISLNPGLFRGLAGVSVALGAMTGYAESTRPKIDHQLHVVVDCYSFRHTVSGALFFLGDNTYRLSADYSTGAAGILAALLSRASGQDLWLPYSTVLSVDSREHLKGGESNE